MIWRYHYKCDECETVSQIVFDTERRGREPTLIDIPDRMVCTRTGCFGTVRRSRAKDTAPGLF